MARRSEGEEGSMETAVRVEHLVKHFKDIKAADDISFRIEKGELFGFLSRWQEGTARGWELPFP